MVYEFFIRKTPKNTRYLTIGETEVTLPVRGLDEIQ